jgi:hypothetical protein
MDTEHLKPVPEKLELMLYSDLQLVQDTRDQLQKDLQKTGWESSLEYQPENALESLTELLASILKSYLDRDSQRFFRLMYVLDLDEKKVMNLLEQPDSFRLLAHMTIMRECMKVILRKNLG